MKKYLSLLPFAFFIALGFSITGCQKCYHCYDTCVLCTRLDSITPDSTHIDSALHCTDYVANQQAYEDLISSDTAAGYTCVSARPTYEYDFCVNQPGNDQYPDYFDKGGRAKCDRK